MPLRDEERAGEAYEARVPLGGVELGRLWQRAGLQPHVREEHAEWQRLE